MTGRRRADESAAGVHANPAHRGPDAQPVADARTQGSAIPVRFPTGMLERVRAAALTEGMTASEWVRRAVDDALAAQGERPGDPESIARELERLARRLRRRV